MVISPPPLTVELRVWELAINQLQWNRCKNSDTTPSVMAAMIFCVLLMRTLNEEQKKDIKDQ